MNKPIKIFIVGFGILISAIIINFLANIIGISTWYSFIANISENGFLKTILDQWAHLFFLIIIYPFLLGSSAYYLTHFLKK